MKRKKTKKCNKIDFMLGSILYVIMIAKICRNIYIEIKKATYNSSKLSWVHTDTLCDMLFIMLLNLDFI